MAPDSWSADGVSAADRPNEHHRLTQAPCAPESGVSRGFSTREAPDSSISRVDLACVVSETGDYQVMNSESHDGTVVYLSGQIDLTTHDTLERKLNDAASGGQNVIVDMSRTTFMDSTGLRALMELWQSQNAAGLDLVIRNPSGPVLRTLHYAGLDRVFKIQRRSKPAP